jgi:hypothetical protein
VSAQHTLAQKVPVLNDEAGLDASYAVPSGLYLDGAGTLFVAGSRGSLLGGDWRENYATMGLPLLAQSVGIPLPYAIESNARYKILGQYMHDQPGQVKNLVGHSKGGAVIDVFKKNNPDFAGKARLYSRPYEDVLGHEKLKDVQNEYQGAIDRKRDMSRYRNPAEEFLEDGITKFISSRLGLDGVVGMKERGTERIANEGDFATLLDRSATRMQHGSPMAHLAGGGPHDYDDGAVLFRTGFDPVQPSDRPGGVDPNYRIPPGVRDAGSFSVPQTNTAPDTGPWITLTE